MNVVMGQVFYLLKMTHSKQSHREGVLSTEDDTQQKSHRERVLSTEDDTQQIKPWEGVLSTEDDTQQIKPQGTCAIY